MQLLFWWQVSKSITDVVLSYLADSVKDKDMNLKAEVIKGQLNNLLTFIEKSLHEDVTVLHTAARDISFTLAHIYIGKVTNKPKSRWVYTRVLWD